MTVDGTYGVTQVQPNVFFGSRLVVSGGETVVTDRLGSVRYSGGQPTSYLPYGIEQTSTPNGQVKFGTYLRDANSSTLGADYADQRYYDPWFGRFNTPDPGGLAVVQRENPTTWNMYAYVNGDPVNNSDPTGLFEEGPTDGCYFNGVWIPGCDIGIGPVSGFFPLTQYGRATRSLFAAQSALEDRSSFSTDCLNDLSAVGAQRGDQFRSELDINSLIDAISGAQFKNGVGSTDPVSSLSTDPRAAAAAGNGTVGDAFAANPNGLTAKSQIGSSTTVGTTIYINPNLIGNNLAVNEGLLFHEGLHLLGFDDADLQRAFGMPVDPNNTKGISTKLQKDCVTGKGNH